MTIPLSRPPVDDEVKAAVIAAVESGQYILGPECKAFEREFAASTAPSTRCSPRTPLPRCGW